MTSPLALRAGSRRTLVSLLVGCVAAVSSGCGSPRDLCDRQCACLGCSADQLQDCYDEAEADKQAAQDSDCLGEYDDLVSCQLDEFACVDGALQTEFCLEEIEDYPACLAGD